MPTLNTSLEHALGIREAIQPLGMGYKANADEVIERMDELLKAGDYARAQSVVDALQEHLPRSEGDLQVIERRAAMSLYSSVLCRYHNLLEFTIPEQTIESAGIELQESIAASSLHLNTQAPSIDPFREKNSPAPSLCAAAMEAAALAEAELNTPPADAATRKTGTARPKP